MKIALQAEPTFEIPVPIHVPGKGRLEVTFTFKFKDDAELKALQSKAAKKKMSDVDYTLEFCAGWELDEEFNKKNIETFFRSYRTAPNDISTAYVLELAGARLKNLGERRARS